MTDRRPKPRQTAFPVRTTAAAVAVLAGGLLAMSYLLPALFDGEGQSGQKAAIPLVTEPVLKDPLATPVTDDLAVGDASPGSADNSATANGVVQNWQPEVKALPKLVTSETVTTESTNYEGRRVVISDEVVQKLMTEPKVSGAVPTDVVDELTGKGSHGATASGAVATTPPASTTLAQSPVTAATPAATTKTASNEPVAAPAPKVALTPVVTLNKKPRNHYSVQLMGASHTKAVDLFVAEHDLAGKVWIYQTKFRGSPWYVVLQGDYASLTQAKSAIRKLSPALLEGQPWPKSFAQIQKELKQ